MTDKITEIHALAVLDVLEAAQEVVDWGPATEWSGYRRAVERLEDALYRLDRIEVLTEAA